MTAACLPPVAVAAIGVAHARFVWPALGAAGVVSRVVSIRLACPPPPPALRATGVAHGAGQPRVVLSRTAWYRGALLSRALTRSNGLRHGSGGHISGS